MCTALLYDIHIYCAGAQQQHLGLVAYLAARTGDERDAPAHVGGLLALREVELRARRAHLIVEVMQLVELRLAHVAEPGRLDTRAFFAARLGGLPRVVAFVIADRRIERGPRRLRQRRAEHRLAAQRADAGLIEDRPIGVAPRAKPLPRERLAERLAAVAIRP